MFINKIIIAMLTITMLTSCNISQNTHVANDSDKPDNSPDNSKEPAQQDTNIDSSSNNSTNSTDANVKPTSTTPKKDATIDKIDELIDTMTTEQKVGQLFIIRPESLLTNLTPDEAHDSKKNGMTKATEAVKAVLNKYPAGGIALFGKNIEAPDQLTSLISDFQSTSNIPMLIGVDEEGGLVSRIANNPNFNVTKYESMEAIGNTNDTSKAYEVGLTIGTYLKQYGFNLDFAPDSDVNTNPENIVIGNRSFGSNPELVSKMVDAEIKGLHDANIMSCIKHFPGHGDTKNDTHRGYVSVDKTWDELSQCELIPFKSSLLATDMIMVSHITLPNVTSDNLPASLSHELITDKLRGQLGYKGIVITDSLAMDAITTDYSSGEAAVKSILAGSDILLMPKDYIKAFDAVYKAVNDGTITEERLNESLRRILSLKGKYSLIQ